MQFYNTFDSKTASKGATVSFIQSVLHPISSGGSGLYLPVRLPVLPTAFIKNVSEMSLRDTAYVVTMMMLGDEIPAADLKAIVDEAFTFETPLHKLDSGIFSLELYHGPSRSYRDLVSRFTAALLKRICPANSRVAILTVASHASAHSLVNAFDNVPMTSLYMMVPHRALINHPRCKAPNAHYIDVLGNVDDCHRLVRKLLRDPSGLDADLVTTADSGNFAALIPLIAVYFHAYGQWLRKSGAAPGTPIVVSIPTGNAGNLCAAVIAKQMGLPLKRLVVANNRNGALVNFLNNAKTSRATPQHTIASSADVTDPINIPRLKALYDNDMDRLRHDIEAYAFEDDVIAETMVDIHSIHSYLLDPHSAMACRALSQSLAPGENGIFLATAHPATFAATIEQTTGIALALRDNARPVEHIARHAHQRAISPNINAVKAFIRDSCIPQQALAMAK